MLRDVEGIELWVDFVDTVCGLSEAVCANAGGGFICPNTGAALMSEFCGSALALRWHSIII